MLMTVILPWSMHVSVIERETKVKKKKSYILRRYWPLNNVWSNLNLLPLTSDLINISTKKKQHDHRMICLELTSLLNGSIKATTAGYLLIRVWYISTNSSGDFKAPDATSYFPLDWREDEIKLNSLLIVSVSWACTVFACELTWLAVCIYN